MSDTTEDAAEAGPAQPDETKTLTFEPPIKLRAATYDTMLLSEPTGRMVRQAEAMLRGGVNVESLRQYQLMLITLVSRWPKDAVEELPITKIDEAGSFLARFTNIGRLTGVI